MAYLAATVRARPNLTVLTETFATGIVSDGQRAIGLDYERGVALMRAPDYDMTQPKNIRCADLSMWSNRT
jgi:choline dehydrogenase-like flavoprotein